MFEQAVMVMKSLAQMPVCGMEDLQHFISRGVEEKLAGSRKPVRIARHSANPLQAVFPVTLITPRLDGGLRVIGGVTGAIPLRGPGRERIPGVAAVGNPGSLERKKNEER